MASRVAEEAFRICYFAMGTFALCNLVTYVIDHRKNSLVKNL
jgi:hypothetical protein